MYFNLLPPCGDHQTSIFYLLSTTFHESHTQMLHVDVLNRRLSSKLYKTNITLGLLPVFLFSCVFSSFSLCVLLSLRRFSWIVSVSWNHACTHLLLFVLMHMCVSFLSRGAYVTLVTWPLWQCQNKHLLGWCFPTCKSCKAYTLTLSAVWYWSPQSSQ